MGADFNISIPQQPAEQVYIKNDKKYFHLELFYLKVTKIGSE